MGEGLVLDRFWLNGSGYGEVGPLEVGGCEVRDGCADGGGKINDRFLNPGGIVVGFGLINLCNPVEKGICRLIKESGGARGLPDECIMGFVKGIDSSLELSVLYKDKRRLAHDQPILRLDKWMTTWGKLGQLVLADLAELFLCSLDIRVEALCEL
jgi:hypothetical protein